MHQAFLRVSLKKEGGFDRQKSKKMKVGIEPESTRVVKSAQHVTRLKRVFWNLFETAGPRSLQIQFRSVPMVEENRHADIQMDR